MTAAYYGRRAVHALVAALFVVTVVFLAVRLVGDPATRMLPIGASPDQVRALRGSLGLDRPLLTQYGEFMGKLVRLDLGQSVAYDQSAVRLVLERTTNTLLIAGLGLGLAFLIALATGIAAALRPGTYFDHSTAVLAICGRSFPSFWVGAMLILVFSVSIHLLPTSGAGGIEYSILPAITIALPVAGGLAQLLRGTLLEELSKPYATALRARGFGELYIVRRHVLRNAIVPTLSYFSLEIARVFAGGVVIVETVFAYPGVGYLMVQALNSGDFVLVQAIVVLAALVILVINFIFDSVYAWVDPRMRSARA